MGLLGVLGKIGKTIGKGALGFATGGPGGAVQGVLDGIAGGGDAAKEGRLNDAMLQTRINEGNNRAQLDAAQFNAGQEGSLMKRALAARMLGDIQGAPLDPRAAKFAGPGISPETLALFSKYGTKADQDVMGGGYRVNPTMSSLGKPGVMEKIGGVAGVGSGILGILGGLRRPQPPVN